MLLAKFIFVVLFAIVLAEFELTIGKFDLVVKGSTLEVSICAEGVCSGTIEFDYTTDEHDPERTQTEEGMCKFGIFGNSVPPNGCLNYVIKKGGAQHGNIFASLCSPKITNGRFTIKTTSLAKHCTVKITNAVTSDSKGSSSGLPVWIYIIIAVVICIIIVIVTVIIVVVYRRKKASRATPHPVVVESKPLLPEKSKAKTVVVETKPEQPNSCPALTTGASKIAGLPSHTTPAKLPCPPTRPPSKEAGPANPTESIDDPADFPDPEQKRKDQTPTHTSAMDPDGVGVVRMHDRFADQRSRPSVLCQKPFAIKETQTTDELERYRPMFETCLEMMARNLFLDHLMHEEVNFSRDDRNNEPRRFKALQRFYDETERHEVDRREVVFFSANVGDQLELLIDLRTEAKRILREHGVQFPLDEPPTFPEEARKFLLQLSTPQFVRVFAYSVEMGHLIPLSDVHSTETYLATYSVQSLLVLAFRRQLDGEIRRAVLAAMSRKLVKLRNKFPANRLTAMAYPTYLIPDAYAYRPHIFDDPARILTHSMENASPESMANHPDPQWRGVRLPDEEKFKQPKPFATASERAAPKSRLSRSQEQTEEISGQPSRKPTSSHRV